MDKIKILLIGRDPVVLQKLLRFINENPEWEGTGTVDDKSAKTLFRQQKYAYVVLIDIFDEAVVKDLHQTFQSLNPQVGFLRHYGDSTNLLALELHDLMEKHPVVIEKHNNENI
ncbi:MAG: hypothetical protein ABIN48_02905 [Ginsengibacter sp.]